jgi:hypothetical protein
VVPVIGGPVAVEGDADLDLVLDEQFTERLAEQHPVGMDAQVQVQRREWPTAAR